MIPYTYNMVSFRGTDLSEISGEAVDGIYGDILSALNECCVVVLYDWKFAGILIPPAYCTIEEGDSFILINGIIKIKDDDTVWIESLIPPEPVLVELTVEENGQFSPQDYDADGFSEVTVDVTIPPPTLVPLSVQENGQFSPQDYDADGFSEVEVAVPPPKYEEVPPDFFGLATAYQALNGSFFTSQGKNQCLFFATVESGEEYVVFLPDQVGTRFRVAKWSGKTFDDFSPYLDTPGTNTEIYTGGTLITPSTELQGDDLTRRFFFTGVDGEVIIGTSNTSQLIKPILLKIKEDVIP